MNLFKKLVILFCCLLVSKTSFAAVTTIQALDFGLFVIKRNDAVYDLTINTDGSSTFDAAGYLEVTPAQEGIYDITGLPASTAILSVTVTQVSALSGPGNSFQMINFQETHPASTDAGGVARIVIGTTAQTSGTGSSYPVQAYSGTVDILINF